MPPRPIEPSTFPSALQELAAKVRDGVRNFKLELLRRNRLHGADAIGDDLATLLPFTPFGRVIALDPCFDGGQHAERLFPSHLVVATGTVMRRAGLPGGLQDVLPSEQQSRALRTADGLAAAVRDDGGAALQVQRWESSAPPRPLRVWSWCAGG